MTVLCRLRTRPVRSLPRGGSCLVSIFLSTGITPVWRLLASQTRVAYVGRPPSLERTKKPYAHAEALPLYSGCSLRFACSPLPRRLSSHGGLRILRAEHFVAQEARRKLPYGPGFYVRVLSRVVVRPWASIERSDARPPASWRSRASVTRDRRRRAPVQMIVHTRTHDVSVEACLRDDADGVDERPKTRPERERRRGAGVPN
jgi:hypothetical protein